MSISIVIASASATVGTPNMLQTTYPRAASGLVPTIAKLRGMMQATGYGSWLQKIVVEVASAEKAAFAHQLGIEPIPQMDETRVARFIWMRKSRSRGSDEDVVWDLTIALGDLSEKSNWRIDWAASDY